MSTPRMLLRHGDFRRLAGVGQLSALPDGMTPLAYTLLTASILGSYRVGSMLVSAGMVAQVVAGPTAGRLLDRVGVERGLRALLLTSAGGYALLAALATHVPEPVLVILAVAPALPTAALSGGVLTAMSQKLPSGFLSPAVALNDTMLEGTLFIGPLLAAALATLAPTAAIAALALGMAVAAALVPPSPSAGRTATADRTPLLRQLNLAPWLLSAMASGVLFGSLEVGALPMAHGLHGGSATAALLLATLCGCSALAGLAYTAFGDRLRWSPLRRTALLLFVPGCAVVVALAAAHTWTVAAPAIAAIGLCTAPLMTNQALGARAVLPEGQRAEGFTMLAAAGGAGYAIGSLAVALLPLHLALLIGAAAPLPVVVVLTVHPGHDSLRATAVPASGA